MSTQRPNYSLFMLKKNVKLFKVVRRAILGRQYEKLVIHRIQLMHLVNYWH